MGQANHSQLPNTIWVWQLGWLASQPVCQLGGKHHLHLGRAEMVQARKQGALHRLGQVIPDLGWSGQPGWFGPGSQTHPRITRRERDNSGANGYASLTTYPENRPNLVVKKRPTSLHILTLQFSSSSPTTEGRRVTAVAGKASAMTPCRRLSAAAASELELITVEVANLELSGRLTGSGWLVAPQSSPWRPNTESRRFLQCHPRTSDALANVRAQSGDPHPLTAADPSDA
jgi:hypothetical protein